MVRQRGGWKAAQVEELVCEHLSEKYQEEFFTTGISESPAHSPLQAPNVWTLVVCPVGEPERTSSFGAHWKDPRPETLDEIRDNYLLVKMRPLFREAIDEGLATVLPEFLAEYDVFAFWDDVTVLPGQISQEEFLQWAARHVTLNLRVSMPAGEGFTPGDLTAQVAPLVDSGNTFGAAEVSAQFSVYHRDRYSKWVSLCEDLVQRRTDPGIVYDCCYRSNLTPGPSQVCEKMRWHAK